MDRYVKTNWVNGQQPAINETNLNKIENGIFDVTETAISNADTIENILGILNNIQISGEITVSDVLLMAHPIGSIYQSENSTSPATLFGGTWQRINDVFLLAAGNDYEAGDTGGSANNMLTVDNLPYFGWAKPYQLIGDTGVWVPTNPNPEISNYNPRPGEEQTSINNMPPYVVVYTWVRTA